MTGRPYPIKTMRSWSHYREWVEDRLSGWLFRGQGNKDWWLWSKISRHLRDFKVHRKRWADQEVRILRVFKRKAHLFLDHVPDDRDEFQWLALMQHHGAPTRLVDLTWSPYVAAFFALESSTTDAAVWCFHHNTIMEKSTVDVEVQDDQGEAIQFQGRDGRPLSGTPIWRLSPKWIPSEDDSRWLNETQYRFHTYFIDGAAPFVFLGEPYVMNQRLIAQNATFALPSRIDIPIEQILTANREWARGLVKLVLPNRIRRAALRDLYTMNITHATLFPDLDGLARSMAQELEYHWEFDPYTAKKLQTFDDPRAGWPSG